MVKCFFTGEKMILISKIQLIHLTKADDVKWKLLPSVQESDIYFQAEVKL